MKRISRTIVIVITIALFIWLYRACMSVRNLSHSIRDEASYACVIVESAGGATAVLLACRQLAETFAPANGRLFYDVPITNNGIPSILRKINLKEIHVGKEYVLIDLDEPGHRAALLAFPDGASEFGSTVITNGLWYWNGTPSKETREVSRAFDARVESYYHKSGN
jgi:hypothetical protein